MIRLDTATRNLQIVLAGAVTTNQSNIVVSYADQTGTSYTGAQQAANSNNTTAVDICASPPAGMVRTVDAINVYNADTVPTTVTVRYNDNGTIYPIIQAALKTLGSLSYAHGSGWRTN